MKITSLVLGCLLLVSPAFAAELSNPCDGAGAGSECFGAAQHIGPGDKQTLIGNNADTWASQGSPNSCFSSCTALGNSTEAWSYESTAVGYHAASLGGSTVCVGVQCQAGSTNGQASSVALGAYAFCTGDSSVCVGRGTSDGNTRDGILLGRDAASGGVPNVFVLGSPNHYVTDGYINSPAVGTTGTRRPYVQHGASGKGTNASGASYKIAGGYATGNAPSGDSGLQTSIPTVSGAAAQQYVDRIVARGKLLSVPNGVNATVLQIPLVANSGGAVTVVYGARAANASDTQQESGQVSLACAESAGGAVVAGIPVENGSSQALTSGTLNVSFAATTGANVCFLQVNVNSSLSAPTDDFYFTVLNNGLQNAIPQ